MTAPAETIARAIGFANDRSHQAFPDCAYHGPGTSARGERSLVFFDLGSVREIDKIRPVVSSRTSRISDLIGQVDYLRPMARACAIAACTVARCQTQTKRGRMTLYGLICGPCGVSRQSDAAHVGPDTRRGETRGNREYRSQAKDGTADPTA